ncbi:MAG: hypothetical protein HKO90_04130 [Flavobacteriaceae bacterium]|nr:hypothetical protein [Bacteroidia bacterium]NNK87449.1 hypothetical protein [Flavobacteriaceae bacterium]
MSKPLNDINEPGFKSPDGYFENFEEALLARIKTEELKRSVDDHGHRLPEDYFSSFEDRVMDKLTPAQTKVIPLFNRKKLYYVSGIAAAIIILVAVFVNRGETADGTLNYETVENYIIEQDVSAYEIASLLTEEEIDAIGLEIISDEMTDETLEDYLLNNIELEEIIEQ